MPALLKDVCERKTWRPNISRTTGTPLWIGGHGSIDEMVVSQTKQICLYTKIHSEAETVERGREKQPQREKNVWALLSNTKISVDPL